MLAADRAPSRRRRTGFQAWLPAVARAMTWLLLALAPGVAWSGPLTLAAASQEEETPDENSDPIAEPKPCRQQPRRRSVASVDRAAVAPQRDPSPTGSAQSARRQLGASIWRPSPLLADPDPPDPLS